MPGSLEHADLGGVAAHHDRPELLLEPREAIGALLDERDLVAHLEQRAGRVRAHLPAARDDDVHQTASCGTGAASSTVSSRTEIAVSVGQTVRMPRRA